MSSAGVFSGALITLTTRQLVMSTVTRGSHGGQKRNHSVALCKGIDVWSGSFGRLQPVKRYQGIHSTMMHTAEATNLINRHNRTRPNVPFFMYLAYNAPHAPFDAGSASAAFAAAYPTRPRRARLPSRQCFRRLTRGWPA